MRGITRRKIIVNMAVASGGMLLGFAVPSFASFDQLRMLATRGPIDGLVAWVKLGSDNLATIVASHGESEAMGLVSTHRCGAVSRWTLIQAVARQWHVPPQSITIDQSRFIHAASGRSATYVPVSGADALPWLNRILRNDALVSS